MKELRRMIGVEKSQRLQDDEEREKKLVYTQTDAIKAIDRLKKEYPGAEKLWKDAVDGYNRIANPGQARTPREADEFSGYETLLTFATTKEGEGKGKEAQKMLEKWERLANGLEKFGNEIISILGRMDKDKDEFFGFGLVLDKLLDEWYQTANDNPISKRARTLIDKRVEEYAKFIEASNAPEQVGDWADALKRMKEFDERLAETIELIKWDIETAGPATQGQTEAGIIKQMEEAVANAFPQGSQPLRGDAKVYLDEAQGRLERAKRNNGREYNILDLYLEMKEIEKYVQKAREAT